MNTKITSKPNVKSIAIRTTVTQQVILDDEGTARKRGWPEIGPKGKTEKLCLTETN